MGLARITRAILRNEQVVLPVGAYLDGEYGEHDIYVGVPSIIHRGGVKKVLELPLDKSEHEKFSKSIQTLKAIQQPFFSLTN